MHDTLLIKTINRDQAGLRNVFFQIGDMDAHIGELMDLLNKPDSPMPGVVCFATTAFVSSWKSMKSPLSWHSS